MILRFSARGDRDDAIVHLTVVETLRFGNIVRVRGDALCRPEVEPARTSSYSACSGSTDAGAAPIVSTGWRASGSSVRSFCRPRRAL